MHRILVDHIPAAGGRLVVAGDEAEHAVRVKRLEPGDAAELLDGMGVVASARVESVQRGARGRGALLEVAIVHRFETPFPGVSPVVEVFTAVPKGPRADEMVDQLSQVGAACWSPLETARSVMEPREGKWSRLERIARESAKQCGRSWVMRLGRPATLTEALGSDGGPVVLADASGRPWSDDLTGALSVRVLIGPEGGWTPKELELARRSGARIVRFGPNVMRIETAAVAACAVLMARGRRETGPEVDEAALGSVGTMSRNRGKAPENES